MGEVARLKLLTNLRHFAHVFAVMGRVTEALDIKRDYLERILI